MLKKGSKLYGILKMKCPKCHEGDLFVSKNSYDLANMTKMHDHCEKCNQSFSPEPNFYYGAMYVSYGYSVALFVAVYLLTTWFTDLGIWGTIGVLTAVLAVLSPFIFRLSRATYIHIFVKYKKDAIAEANH